MANWTNPSVIAFSGNADPVAKIQELAQKWALLAIEKGWAGPPYNPIVIAEMLGATVVPNYDIADARTIAVSNNAIIEFNPSQSRERVRFSIAHEAAHLLFPDVLEETRHRGGSGASIDEWQLEMLCNLAASEFVMPIGSFATEEKISQISDLMKLRAQFDVSAEAFMIRYVKTSRRSVGIVCASPFKNKEGNWSYQVNYYIPSSVAPRLDLGGRVIPDESAVHRCTAIGFTDFGLEDWITESPVQTEYVGIPAFPGCPLPRAIGLIHFDRAEVGHAPIKYVQGDATRPHGKGPRVICQLVNDRAFKWGGGIARQTAKKYPKAEEAFAGWLSSKAGGGLGEVHLVEAEDNVSVASLVAQDGFGVSSTPRIRYSALERCLYRLWALLHKAYDGRISPFPGQTHPTTSVTGVPSAVKPFRTATRTWNSAT